MVEGTPPLGTPLRHPDSEQRRPARAHAVGPVLGPHARTDRTRDTRVAEPWLPAPEDGRPGEGQRLTRDAPHNDGRPAPPGTAPHQPRGTQPPEPMQAKGTFLGPHTAVFSSCFFPKFKIMHFQNRDIKLYTVVLLFLFFLKFLLKLCCR